MLLVKVVINISEGYLRAKFYFLSALNRYYMESIRKLLHNAIYLQSCSSASGLPRINSWSLFLSNKCVRCHIIRQENEVTAQRAVINTVIIYRDK